MEISIIWDNEVVFEKEFKGIKKYIENEKFMKMVCASITIAMYNTQMTYAKDYTQISSKIRTSTNPIIELLAGLGYPVTYAMLIVGTIMIITGKKSKGLDVIKWACIGYVGLQFVPFLLNLLEEIGRDMRAM